ncbi:MAG: hypothetical protein OSB69_11890, partial [Alphaproteobacteria bacterium]|nr:hypothetical protein [Alphaproteobacteria bacterium]
VKHLAWCWIESRPARLDLACYPHLALTAVATTSPSSYSKEAAWTFNRRSSAHGDTPPPRGRLHGP